MLPATNRFPFTSDLSICRILNGMWQVSGGHGAIDPAPFRYPIADFYRTDPISRASPTMQQCSEAFGDTAGRTGTHG